MENENRISVYYECLLKTLFKKKREREKNNVKEAKEKYGINKNASEYFMNKIIITNIINISSNSLSITSSNFFLIDIFTNRMQSLFVSTFLQFQQIKSIELFELFVYYTAFALNNQMKIKKAKTF